MRWFNKITFRKNSVQILKVGISRLAEYYQFEIQNTIPWQKYIQIAYALIEEAFSEHPMIAMSQYIDEHQGTLAHRDIILNELNTQHHLLIEQTQKYDSCVPSTIQDSEYIVHASGVLETNWLKKILRFDGGGLAPVMYGIYQQNSNWLNTLIDFNKTFVSWYYLKIEKEAILPIAHEVGSIAWGSDAWLYLLVNETRKADIELMLTEVTNKYDADWAYI